MSWLACCWGWILRGWLNLSFVVNFNKRNHCWINWFLHKHTWNSKKKRNYCLIIYITHAPGPFLLIFLIFFLNPPDTWNEKFAKTCKQLLFKKSYIHHFTIDGLPQSFKQNQIINNFIKKNPKHIYMYMYCHLLLHWI